MSRPKSATDLTPKQVITYEKLLAKEEKMEKDLASIEHFQNKKEKFIDPPLSEAAKRYLIERYSKERYGKRVAATNKQKWTMAKGTALEDEAMKLLSKLHKIGYSKPVGFAENEFIYGKCDILCMDHQKLVETKISWSSVTFFPYFDRELPASVWFQVQGYLDLYGLTFAQVCYVLVNTPKHLIEQEEANLFRRYTFGEIDREKYDEGMMKIEGFYNYENIPLKRRVITYEVTKSEEALTKIRRKVELCREWLNEFEAIHMNNKKVITLAENYVKGQPESDIESDSADPRESDSGGSDILSD